LKIPILLRKTDFLAVDKPAGVLSQKDKSGEEDLASLLKKQEGIQGFLAPVHRLDRNTSGLLILALNSGGADILTKLLKEGKVRKKYIALVKGDPGESGTYEFPLSKDEAENKATHDEEGGKEAITHYKRLAFYGNSSLVEVEIETGRSHQIRAHFSLAGHALIGDRKYAKKPWSEIFERPALHAQKLSFPWKGEDLEIEAPIPQSLELLLQKLGGKK